MKIEIEVKDSDVTDCIIGAFDAGIAYWARIASYVEPYDKRAEYMGQIPMLGGTVQLAVIDAWHSVKQPLPLNRETIAAGLKIMAERHPRHFVDLVDDRMDALTGDVLVQLAVFGAIVFG